jgi:hypothetical protein
MMLVSMSFREQGLVCTLSVSDRGAHTGQVCCCPCQASCCAPAFVEAAEVYGSGKHQQEEMSHVRQCIFALVLLFVVYWLQWCLYQCCEGTEQLRTSR